LTLADTAGLRSARDEIEAEGVRRTRSLIRESRLVLAVVEMQMAPDEETVRLVADLAGEAPVLPVANKMDLGGDPERWKRAIADPSERGEGAHPILPCSFVSARTGEGVDALKGRIVEALCGGGGGARGGGAGGPLDSRAGEVLLTNARHIDALRRAHEALGRTQAALEEGVTEELLAFEVRGAVQAMGEISGESVTEEVLDSIFSKFCVGK
jgi:tRNA modification GTPase